MMESLLGKYLSLSSDRLDKTDILSLVLFFICVVMNVALKEWSPFLHIILAYTGGTVAWMIITADTFGLRFSNRYFSLSWLLLSVAFLYGGYIVSWLPLLSFLLYHVFRFVFRRKFGREFIPFKVVRSSYYRFYSKKQGRVGGNHDKKHMKWLFWVGFLMYMLCLFGMVGTKIS